MKKLLGALTLAGVLGVLGFVLNALTFNNTESEQTKSSIVNEQRHKEDLELQEVAERHAVFIKAREALQILQQNYGHRKEIATGAHWDLRQQLDKIHSLKDMELDQAFHRAIQASYDVELDGISSDVRYEHSQILSDALRQVEAAGDRYPLIRYPLITTASTRR